VPPTLNVNVPVAVNVWYLYPPDITEVPPVALVSVTPDDVIPKIGILCA
jgi:hypothetical protein